LNYDCIIIGGGLSGLTCGIYCAGHGLKTAVLSYGMNSLHFSSGSIDLFGYTPRKKIIRDPFEHIKKTTRSNPDHPYSKTGVRAVQEGVSFLKEELGKAGLKLYNNGTENHFHITGLGTMKPSYFSQESVYNEHLQEAFLGKPNIRVLNFEGFRDYYEELTLDQLKKNPLVDASNISTGRIRLPVYGNTEKNPHEFRSIDLARIFDTEKYLPRIADEIKKAAGDAEIVSLPAFIGIDNYNHIHRRLQEMTGLFIYEVPTLPPSILGMRIDNALRDRFAALGGVLSDGDRVSGGDVYNGILENVKTELYSNTEHRARHFVLATGSFLSGGLRSAHDLLDEPVFGLRIKASRKRNRWYSDSFFHEKSHPFLEFGVETNSNLNPFDKNGTVIKNLWCTGSILSGYNPIRESSGGGVAVCTGYYAAKKIVSDFERKRKK